jgi:hypothetical protein
MISLSSPEHTGVAEQYEALVGELAKEDVPVKHVRRTVAALNVLLEYGLQEVNLWEFVNLWKARRIETIGYKRYLYEVLGSAGNCLLAQCRLWRGDEELDLAGLSYWPGRPLVDYLCFLASECDAIDELPDQVEVNRNGSKLTTFI